MKCPYCAEDINDAAIVCRYCGRDFQLLKPLIEKVAGLELDLNVLQAQLAQICATDHAALDSPPTHLKRDSNWIIVSSVTLSVVGSIGLYWLFDSGGKENQIFLFGSIAFPVVGGLINGLKRISFEIGQALALGALIGFLDLIGTMLIYQGQLWPLPHDFGFVVGVILLGQAVIFTFSSYLGSFLAKRMKLIPLSEGGSERVAAALARITHKTNSNTARDIEFWKTFLASLTPIFTLAGTIVTAYFTYLAALAKH